MSTPFCLQIPRRIYEEMLIHARTDFPKECCGLLAGKILPRPSSPGVPATSEFIAMVDRYYPLINVLASPVEFLSEPRSMFAAMRAMRRHGLDILAVYHSHPTSPPIPSRTDLDRNYSESVVNCILSLQSQQPELCAWWLMPSSYREAEWCLME